MPIFRGLKFPFSKVGKELPAKEEDEELIKQSIIQILMTERGERVMASNFGNIAKNFLFENTDLVRAQILKNDIAKTLTTYEKRITVKNILLNIKDTTLFIHIEYKILSNDKLQSILLGLPIPAAS